jgi:hypothetical protein
VRSQIVAEPAVLGVELEQALGIVDCGLDLGLAAHHGLIVEQALDIALAEIGDGDWFELGEGATHPVPPGIDHEPAHPRLEDEPAERFEVAGEIPGPSPRRVLAVHPDRLPASEALAL